MTPAILFKIALAAFGVSFADIAGQCTQQGHRRAGWALFGLAAFMVAGALCL